MNSIPLIWIEIVTRKFQYLIKIVVDVHNKLRLFERVLGRGDARNGVH